MKAISPVIATLILIAIAVIAGIFVLRQFLFFAGTAGQQDVLAIEDATLSVLHKANYMQVYLQITLKNQGDKVVNVTSITVDGKSIAGFTYVVVNPGSTYSFSGVVMVTGTGTITDPSLKEQWEAGTEHTIIVTYDVIGGNTGQQTVIKVRAT